MTDKQNWKAYENDIYSLLKDQFPDSVIKSNTKITGRYSIRKRQVDVLVEGFTGGRKFRQLVECKYFNKTIDVKIVESILGFLDDVAADRAIIITNKGYTKSAYKRAHNDPRFIELQICSFDEIRDHQGLYAICYRGKNGLIIKAPIGWVADNLHIGNDSVCNLNLRGKTVEDAIKEGDLIMVNIYNKDFLNINGLELFQSQRNKLLKKNERSAEITKIDTISRYDGKVSLDKINIPRKGLQFSGYIEFENFITTIDLMIKPELESSRLTIIEQLLFEIKPYQTQFKNDIDSALWNISNAYYLPANISYKPEIFAELKGIIDEIKNHHKEDLYLVNEYFKDSPEVVALIE